MHTPFTWHLVFSWSNLCKAFWNHLKVKWHRAIKSALTSSTTILRIDWINTTLLIISTRTLKHQLGVLLTHRKESYTISTSSMGYIYVFLWMHWQIFVRLGGLLLLKYTSIYSIYVNFFSFLLLLSESVEYAMCTSSPKLLKLEFYFKDGYCIVRMNWYLLDSIFTFISSSPV